MHLIDLLLSIITFSIFSCLIPFFYHLYFNFVITFVIFMSSSFFLDYLIFIIINQQLGRQLLFVRFLLNLLEYSPLLNHLYLILQRLTGVFFGPSAILFAWFCHARALRSFSPRLSLAAYPGAAGALWCTRLVNSSLLARATRRFELMEWY